MMEIDREKEPVTNSICTDRSTLLTPSPLRGRAGTGTSSTVMILRASEEETPVSFDGEFELERDVASAGPR
jgi:hypothetical protein